MSLWALAAVLAVGGPAGPEGPDVRGDSRCPSPAQVARQLGPLLLPDGELPPDTWLEISRPATTGAEEKAEGKPEEEIEMRMMKMGVPPGVPPVATAARRLAVPTSCDEAAQAVAVVAATWTANYLTPPPLCSIEPPRSDRRDPATGRVAVIDEEMPSVRRARPLALAVGVELGMTAATAGTSAPFLLGELDVRGSSPTSARLVAMAFGARTLALGSGEVAWRRLMAGAGVAHAWGTPAAHLQIGADVVAGATFIAGVGFAQNAASTGFDAGGGPWVRAGARLAAAPLTVWLGAQGLAWAREERVQVDGVVSRDALPRLDLLVGAGVSWWPLAEKLRRP